MKKWIIMLVAGIAIGVGTIIWVQQSNPQDELTWPSGLVVAVDETHHNWGNIDIRGGEVAHTFTLKNNSNETLEIRKAVTSCMCTTAIIEIPNEKPSPSFGMHTRSSSWRGLVPAGETFEVHVIFDPMAHGPSSVGQIHRSVYLETSSAPGGIAENQEAPGSIVGLTVEGKVLSSEDYAKTTSKAPSGIVMGDFIFEETEHDFGTIAQSGGIQTHVFPFVYTGEEEITVSDVVGSCACTTGSIEPLTLSPGDSGELSLVFDPNLHEEPEGRFFKTITIQTDPSLNDLPEVKMWAEIDLDLGPDAYKLKEHND